jgi:hypothetical protein
VKDNVVLDLVPLVRNIREETCEHYRRQGAYLTNIDGLHRELQYCNEWRDRA